MDQNRYDDFILYLEEERTKEDPYTAKSDNANYIIEKLSKQTREEERRIAEDSLLNSGSANKDREDYEM